MLDANGRELSNSPAIEFKLLSGPGEFPTGSSIRFTPDGDIRIVDGKAAIAFRSFYAGTAVIEATSPGLKPARIKISFTEAPVYQKGKTPAPQERPYIRYTKGLKERELQTFGQNNPTFSSSSAQGFSAGYATDGNTTTWWQPAEEDKNVYWMLDTEKGLELKSICIRFPHAKAYQYRVESSLDRQHWELLSDQTGNTESIEKQDINAEKGIKARFIRISFPKVMKERYPALTEVIVTGFVLE